MAITGVSNYTSYTNYYADTKQTASKTYGNAREYRKYLTEKYDCLKSKDYSVAINGSLMAQAASDEKIAKWLEYNLSIMPECIEKTREAAEARGAKLISCNITINGYDSMTAEVMTRVEADPGTEKTRKQLEERIKKKAEEKKAEEKKAEEKKDEDSRLEELSSNLGSTFIENEIKIHKFDKKI